VAETLRSSFAWDSEEEWRVAGGRLHMLQGHVVIERPATPASPAPAPFVESIWHDSYEASQHLLQVGQADEPVCWTLTGFASGYLSLANGREVYCIEDRCRGKGDPVCHLVGKFREDWGPEIEPHLAFYDKAHLDSALEGVAAALRSAERRLRARREELARFTPGAGERKGLVVRSEAMGRVVDLALRVAKVIHGLITGERRR
jgi:hypothetical protein